MTAVLSCVGVYTRQSFPQGLRCIRCDYIFHVEGELYYWHWIGDGVEYVCEACKGTSTGKTGESSTTTTTTTTDQNRYQPGTMVPGTNQSQVEIEENAS